MARLLGDAKALMLRGHGAVVVGQSIREVCMLALFLEESARLQTDAMRLGTPLFMERDEAEKIAKRTFKPSSVRTGLGPFCGQMRRLILSLALVARSHRNGGIDYLPDAKSRFFRNLLHPLDYLRGWVTVAAIFF